MRATLCQSGGQRKGGACSEKRKGGVIQATPRIVPETTLRNTSIISIAHDSTTLTHAVAIEITLPLDVHDKDSTMEYADNEEDNKIDATEYTD